MPEDSERCPPCRGTGKLTSTALTGLNMNSAELDFTAILGGAHPFGESGKYPAGISYGSLFGTMVHMLG